MTFPPSLKQINDWDEEAAEITNFGSPIIRGPFVITHEDFSVSPQRPITALELGNPLDIITISGNHIDEFIIGGYVEVEGSTGNDGSCLITSVDLVGGNTKITVTNNALNDPTIDGTVRGGMNVGIPFYTPTVGEILLDAWIEVIEAWDAGPIYGVPNIDIGTFVNAPNHNGLLSFSATSLVLTTISSEPYGDGMTLLRGYQDGENLSLMGWAYNANYNGTPSPAVPARFTQTYPLRAVVNRSAALGGLYEGSLNGIAHIYLITVTPLAP